MKTIDKPTKPVKALRHLLTLTLIGGIIILAGGCNTTKTTTYQPTQDFTRYKTFAFAESPASESASDPVAPLPQHRAIEASLSQVLVRKGFTEASPAEADFLVKVHGDLLWYYPNNSRWQERTGVVEIIDAKTKEIVWSTSRTKVSDAVLTPELAGQLAAKMIEPFPPEKK